MRIKRARCKSIVDQNRHVETVYEFSECVQVGSYVELVLQELADLLSMINSLSTQNAVHECRRQRHRAEF